MNTLQNILIFLLSQKTIKRLVYYAFARRFLAGETMEDALKKAEELNRKGFIVILNFLGEKIKNEENVYETLKNYLKLAQEINQRGLKERVSVKPSQLGMKISKNIYESCLDAIGFCCAILGIPMEVDMEEYATISTTIKSSIKLKEKYPSLDLRQALQARVPRTINDILELKNAGIKIRLCKGVKTYASQKLCINDEDTRLRMVVAAMALPTSIEIASHDLDILNDLSGGVGVQLLYGFLPKTRERLAKTRQVAIYLPFGTNWIPYGVRRLPYILSHLFKEK